MEDQELVNQVLKGSDSAFKMLIERYQRLVGHMVSRVVDSSMDKEEICQDVFIKVFEKLNTFQFESKLSTWIATIAYRNAINFAKKRKMEQVELENVAFKIGEEVNLTEEKDMVRFIHNLVDQLPVHYKTVLTLFYLDGFSYPDIVEVTGMPEGTVKNYIHRAKSKLKDIVMQEAEKEVALL